VGSYGPGVEVRRRDRNARLRALTSAAYTAAAGHLELSPEDDVVPARRRWVPSARSAVVAGAAVLACALAVVVVAWLGRPGDPVPLPPPSGAVTAGDVGPGVVEPAHGEEPPAPGAGTTAGGAPASPGTGGPGGPTGTGPAVVVVHVAGAVAAPGVVELPAGARVGEAVDAAGGATEEAALGAVNLARVLVDGEQVYVPAEGEQPPGADAGGGAVAAGAGDSGADGAGGGGAGAGAPVNLNTATAAELDSLPGVGPAIAQRILEWRDLNGPFTSVDDLDEVSGIGPATLERLRPLVTV